MPLIYFHTLSTHKINDRKHVVPWQYSKRAYLTRPVNFASKRGTVVGSLQVEDGRSGIFEAQSIHRPSVDSRLVSDSTWVVLVGPCLSFSSPWSPCSRRHSRSQIQGYLDAGPPHEPEGQSRPIAHESNGANRTNSSKPVRPSFRPRTSLKESFSRPSQDYPSLAFSFFRLP